MKSTDVAGLLALIAIIGFFPAVLAWICKDWKFASARWLRARKPLQIPSPEEMRRVVGPEGNRMLRDLLDQAVTAIEDWHPGRVLSFADLPLKPFYSIRVAVEETLRAAGWDAELCQDPSTMRYWYRLTAIDEGEGKEDAPRTDTRVSQGSV